MNRLLHETPRGRIAIVVMIFLSIMLALSVTLLFVNKQHDASYSNCRQIEVIKAQIRGTVKDSQDRLPTLAYYKAHHAELRTALNDSKKSLRRFERIDCKSLTGT